MTGKARPQGKEQVAQPRTYHAYGPRHIQVRLSPFVVAHFRHARGLFRFFEILIWWSPLSIPATGTVILLHEREKVRESFPWYDERQSLTLATKTCLCRGNNIEYGHRVADGVSGSRSVQSPSANDVEERRR